MPVWLSFICTFILLGAFIGFAAYIYKRVAIFCNNKNAALSEIEKRCQQEVAEKKACYEGIKKVMYSMMLNIEKQCQTAGYSSSEERELFQSLYDVFVAMHGNFNSKEVKERFYEIPTYEKARREKPALIYAQLEKEGNWIYDNSIPDSELSPDLANLRKIKTGKGIAQPE